MTISGLFHRGLPRSFIFEVTAQCNLDCLHCYNVWKNAAGYPEGQLDTRRTLAMLERMIRQMRPRVITLTGGEPFMRQDLAEIVDFIHDQKIAINLISNEKKCQGNCKAAAEVCYGDPCACEPFLQTFIGQARRP